jgi:hypothetical protein
MDPLLESNDFWYMVHREKGDSGDEILTKEVKRGRRHSNTCLKMWKEGIRIDVLEIRDITAEQDGLKD